ncbi:MULTISPECIES: MarR family winged helix-turn-helix transcriptional regulator [unclassified Pseudoclavibacter]|uniref:MarR family winged helix-turn-helix transcriptional regulator n=1 Tax=unclassified Pseudoclavibacter TaxID=2615177 RepID=UPI0015E493AD|nr:MULTISPECIES: MarR family winged helix-turn-helix transcriptional regulator [unclassified Pseudoclavibacter]
MTLILHARSVEAVVESRLKEQGLSLRRFGLLGHLRATPGISFSDLARRAGIKVQSLQPIVQTLLDLGYVHTIGGVGQGRAAVLELTSTGSDALDRATEMVSEVDGELFADGEWKDLGDALVRLATTFQRDRRKTTD